MHLSPCCACVVLQDLLRVAEEEAARERAMVDEIVRRIRDEDMAEASSRRQKQDDTKAYIARFLEEQAVAKRAKIANEQAEDRKIHEYWQMVREREAEEAARKAAMREEADRMYEKVKREMEEAQRAREEEDQLINMLRQVRVAAKRLRVGIVAAGAGSRGAQEAWGCKFCCRGVGMWGPGVGCPGRARWQVLLHTGCWAHASHSTHH